MGGGTFINTWNINNAGTKQIERYYYHHAQTTIIMEKLNTYYYKLKHKEVFIFHDKETAITFLERIEQLDGSIISIATTLGRREDNNKIQLIKGRINNFGAIEYDKNIKKISYETYRQELTEILDKWNDIIRKNEIQPNTTKIEEYTFMYNISWRYGTIEEIPVILFDAYKTIIDDERNKQIPKR